MFPFAHDRGGPKQQCGAVRCGRVFPRFERLRGFFDSAIREFLSGFIKTSDYLRAIGWIDTLEDVAGGDSFTADDQRILAPEFALNFLQRSAHRLRVLFFAEISKRFVTKFCRHILLLNLSRRYTRGKADLASHAVFCGPHTYSP